jgi:hypothetical protein
LGGGEVGEARFERVGEERGFTGLVGRVSLTYANDDRRTPSSVIVKLPMAEADSVSGYRAAQRRDPVLARRYYERCVCEERFYREVGAAFAPARYYSAVDDTEERVVLLLEDLSAGRPGDVLSGCSVDEAALVLETVAPLHDGWMGRTESLSFPRWADFLDARQQRYDRQVDGFLSRYSDRLPADVTDAVEGLRSRLAQILAPLAEQPQTLIHADLHLDNILFDVRRRGEVVLLDWQTLCVGPVAVDIATFVFGSLAVEDRRAAESALLPDELLQDCRLALLSLLAGTVGWLAASDVENFVGRERALVEAALGNGRLVAALLDHEVVDLVGR